MARPVLRALRESPCVLLVDEIDRATAIRGVPAGGPGHAPDHHPGARTIRAERAADRGLTSNRTRELHDALKRRCLYHWIDHPGLDRDWRSCAAGRPSQRGARRPGRAPGAGAAPRRRAAQAARVSETLEWARALHVLGLVSSTPRPPAPPWGRGQAPRRRRARPARPAAGSCPRVGAAGRDQPDRRGPADRRDRPRPADRPRRAPPGRPARPGPRGWPPTRCSSASPGPWGAPARRLARPHGRIPRRDGGPRARRRPGGLLGGAGDAVLLPRRPRTLRRRGSPGGSTPARRTGARPGPPAYREVPQAGLDRPPAASAGRAPMTRPR